MDIFSIMYVCIFLLLIILFCPSAVPASPDTQVSTASSQLNSKFDKSAWSSIASQSKLTFPLNSRVKRRINQYNQHPYYLYPVAKRAKPYIFHVIQALKQKGLPMELALLPIVESHFDPFAESRTGAKGVWQLMEGTANYFGVETNAWYDGRLDIEMSTSAALDYLHYLYKKCGYNWLLAIAAYNSGENRVREAIKKNKRLGKKTDFWSLSLPKETRQYVPKLLALVHMLKHPSQYELKWPKLVFEKNTQYVEVGQQIDIFIAARITGMSMAEIYHLNPAMLDASTPPMGPHRLLLPIEQAEKFNGLLQRAPAKQLGGQDYEVVKGDNLYKIAKQFHTSVRALKTINQLETNILHPKQILRVPIKSLPKLTINYEISPYLERMPDSIHKVRHLHTVKEGESIWRIAKKYRVAFKELAQWNNLPLKGLIKPGKRLIVWLNGNESDNNTSIFYKVRQGDSLSVIASRFRVKVSELAMWNEIDPLDVLKPGQTLTLFISRS